MPTNDAPQLGALRKAAQVLLAALKRKHGHRSDVMLHDYGPRDDDVLPGKHRPDCTWCALERAILNSRSEVRHD